MGVQPLFVGAIDLQGRALQRHAVLWKLIGCGERLLALFLLVALLPFLFSLAIAIMLLSRRTPLIAHRRVGKLGRELWVLKLRTMWSSPAGPYQLRPVVEPLTSDAVPEIKSPCDLRVTSAFGAWCRRFSIDELPQLWNVVRGEMALVGPRPLTSYEIARFYAPSAHQILALKPGITGLWQVKGRSRLTYSQRRRLDLFLTDHWSLPLYMMIWGSTIPRVLTGKDAW